MVPNYLKNVPWTSISSWNHFKQNLKTISKFFHFYFQNEPKNLRIRRFKAPKSPDPEIFQTPPKSPDPEFLGTKISGSGDFSEIFRNLESEIAKSSLWLQRISFNKFFLVRTLDHMIYFELTGKVSFIDLFAFLEKSISVSYQKSPDPEI